MMDILVTVRLTILFFPLPSSLFLPPLSPPFLPCSLPFLPCFLPFLVTSLLSSSLPSSLLSLSLFLSLSLSSSLPFPSLPPFSSPSLFLLFCVHLVKHYSFLSSDINECVLGTNNCNQNCNNTIGSYYCSCDPGYHLLNHPHICSGIIMSYVLCCLY